MSVKVVRALNRGLDVLEAIQASKAASLHDLHLATTLPKPTLLRILKTLIGRDLVWQRIADGAYIASYMFSKRAGAIDEELHLAEAAAPILADLCKRVRWPSILAVPRLDHMVVIETNRPMSYFNYILAAPIGFRINMLRSASGRTYLAFCSQKERAPRFSLGYAAVRVRVTHWREVRQKSIRSSPKRASADTARAIRISAATTISRAAASTTAATPLRCRFMSARRSSDASI